MIAERESNDELAEEDRAEQGVSGWTPLPPVIIVDELAVLLRVDRKAIYAAIQRGEIPGVRRVGRTIRLHRDTVLAWLATGQDRAPRSRRSR